jgi:hypothetical protein
MIILLILLFTALALALFSGDWRSGLLITVVIGFAQDPIRKLTPGQPGLYVGFVLVAFVASAFVLWQRHHGRFDLPLIFPATPVLRQWFPAFVLLIAIQAINALLQWGIPLRTLIGVGFYLSPLVGLWVGFQLGRFQPFLRQLLQLYLFTTALFGFTALLDYLGAQSPLFDSVGRGLLIHFRRGFFSEGAIGLWRSTDIAAIHLTIGACLAMVFALSGSAGLQRTGWLSLSGVLAFTTLLTGRRKAIVQVLVFVVLFIWLLSRYGTGRSRKQLFGLAISTIGLALMVLVFDPRDFLGDDLGEYFGRAASAPDDLWNRFNLLGLNAFWRGLAISNGMGLGVGTLAQTGDAAVQSVRGEGFAFVSESGLGKVTAELGIPGILVLVILGFGLVQAVRQNLAMIRYLPPAIGAFEIGLLAFALSNLPFFSAAAGVYGDPFVLILCGICFGSFFAVPMLLSQHTQRISPQLSSSPRHSASFPLRGAPESSR